MLDLNAMLLFAKVVELQSFSEAARELNMPKSTVSRKIAQMEEQLGVRLLQRNTRQVRLSDVGREVYLRSQNILSELQGVHATVESAREEVSGSLKVQMPVSLNTELTATLLAGFLKLYPKVDLEVQFADSDTDLIGQDFDIAIKFGPLSDSNLVAKLIFERELILVASPGYISRFGEPETIEALQDHYGLMVGSGRSAPIWPLGTGQDRRLVNFKPRTRVNSSVAILEMARKDLGIALVTRTQCAPLLKSGALQQVLPTVTIEPLTCYGLYPSRLQLAPKISQFLDYFAKSAAATSSNIYNLPIASTQFF